MTTTRAFINDFPNDSAVWAASVAAHVDTNLFSILFVFSGGIHGRTRAKDISRVNIPVNIIIGSSGFRLPSSHK